MEYPKREDFYDRFHGCFNGQAYDAAVRDYYEEQLCPPGSGMHLGSHFMDDGQIEPDDDSTYYEPEESKKEPEKPKITPEIQTRIDQARAEIKKRKKEAQWGAICVATKSLIEGNHKVAAKNLIQTYLKAHQR